MSQETDVAQSTTTTRRTMDETAQITSAGGSSKPRARLGPMEIVQLPPDSDSEDEGDEPGGEEGEERAIDDFLKDHPDDTEDLHLQHLRLKNASLPPLRLNRFGHTLKRLCLRQNELVSPLLAGQSEGQPEGEGEGEDGEKDQSGSGSEGKGLFRGLGMLEELDLYDNRLGPVVRDEEVKGLDSLTSLDFSFNNLRHAPNLPSLTKVQVLYLVQNKIGKVEPGDLDWCSDTITSIELGGNRIRVIENLDKLVHLTELWLGKNKIRTLENLSSFTSLKILSLQSNRITKMENLEDLVNLEELYLSHNGLKKIEGLEKNTKLKTLDIGNNTIEEIENISHLSELEEFWASGNQIQNLRALDSQLAPLRKLETVYLEGNPCQTNDRSGYRRKIILALPQVKQIDATFVRLS